MKNPTAQIVSGLLFRYSKTSKEPENTIPATDTSKMSFRPVAKANLPPKVNSRITSRMVYIVNPYMQDGYPRTRVHPPFSGHVFDVSTLTVR